MSRSPSADHELSDADEHVHHVWDNALEPVLTVEPGDVVRFACRDATNGQLGPGSIVEDVPAMDRDPVHPLTGPVAVAGAAPGDVLQVDLLSLEHRGWGVTFVLPGASGAGLLPDAFPDPGLYVWELAGDVGSYVRGIEVPLHPFPGIVGVAPAEPGVHSTTPPRSVGGNLDVKHLTAGSTVYLPVAVPDALFSVGDCHAAQGDGEVCISGIEAPMTVTARLSLRPDKRLAQPQFETVGPFTPTGRDEPMYGTTGVDADLMEATRKAIRHMLDHLQDERGLTRLEGYLLCSVAVDLKVNQVVDAPHWTVSAYLPESLFPG